VKKGRRQFLLAAAVVAAPRVWAQGKFPDKPIRMIVPYSAGGSTDAQMRALCEAASKRLGQPVVTENRSGGGGIMGAQVLAGGTKPDGYTLAQMPISVFRHPWVAPRPAFDPLTDFTWIAQVTGYLFGVVVKADAPWRTLDDAIAYARTDPGGFSYATTGVGSSMDMTMQDIAKRQGVEFTHVPFRGSSESLQALLGRQISAVATSSDWARMVMDGSVRLLFTCGRERSKMFPETPTLMELGYGIVTTSPYGLAGPRGIPAEIVEVLQDAFHGALDDPDYQRVVDRLGMQNEYLDSAAYTASVRRQVAEEREVVERFNLRQGG
jgi:tripartite-type tricarboxylate transporter receptor subunit TctC